MNSRRRPSLALKRAAWALACLAAFASHAQVFKWTDSGGKVHYGDKPPPDAKAQETKIYNIAREAPSSDVEVLPVELEPYPVRGYSLGDLYATMRQAAPKDGEGKPVWGHTQWRMRWKFKYDATSGCRIGSFTIAVSARMRMPEWLDRGKAPPELQGKWDSFYRALRTHEDGHRDNGIRAGNDLARRLRGMEAYRDCDALNAAIANMGRRITGEYQLVDEAYDRSTGHGVTQGAVLR